LNSGGHHLTNILLHSVNTYIVVLLIIGLIKTLPGAAIENGSPLNERVNLVIGGVAGILFGLHPLHVESVAWIAERKDLLCALFFLLSIRMYTRYVNVAKNETDQKNPLSHFFSKWYLFTLGFFLLALLSKPMAVTLPLVLLILDWYPFDRIPSLETFWGALVEKLPFLALSLVSSILTIFAQRAGGSIVPIEFAPLSTRALVAAKALMAYLWKMAVPLNLMPFYPYPLDVSVLSFEYLSAIALVLGITVISMVIASKQKFLLSVWGYYVVTLMPVLGIVQVGNQFIADRYSYLPSLGPFLLMGLMVAWISEKINALKRWNRPAKLAFLAVASVVLVSLAYLTVQQIGIWKDSIALWGSVIKNEPERAPLAYYNRGVVYAKKGQVDKAIDDFNRTITLDPSDYQAYYNLGVLYGKAGSYDKAIQYFSVAIEINQGYDPAYFNRGKYYAKTGKMELALADYQKACELGNENGCREMKLRTP
jgi:hypothetical protein